MTTIFLGGHECLYFGIEWQKMLDTFGLKEFHAQHLHRRKKRVHGLGQPKSRWPEGRDRWTPPEVEGQAFDSVPCYRLLRVETRFHTTVPAARNWKQAYPLAFQHTVADLRECADAQASGQYIVPTFDNSREFIGEARDYYAKRNRDRKLGTCRSAPRESTFSSRRPTSWPGSTASTANAALQRESETPGQF